VMASSLEDWVYSNSLLISSSDPTRSWLRHITNEAHVSL